MSKEYNQVYHYMWYTIFFFLYISLFNHIWVK
nr:MAG TPA: hypothetical protein [Caudoviricetes sp.]